MGVQNVTGNISAGVAKVSLFTHHGKYVVAEADGRCRADRGHCHSWEQFALIANGDGTVSFRSCHNKYMIAHPGGALNFNAGRIGPWEKFTMGVHGVNGRQTIISLKSAHGKYVAAEHPSHDMTANRGHCQTWEKFKMNIISKL